MVPCAGFPTVHVTITNSSSFSNLCLYQPFSCFVQLLEFLGLTPRWNSTSYCQGTLKNTWLYFHVALFLEPAADLNRSAPWLFIFAWTFIWKMLVLFGLPQMPRLFIQHPRVHQIWKWSACTQMKSKLTLSYHKNICSIYLLICDLLPMVFMCLCLQCGVW